jgi:hypothetical protein
VIFGDDNRPMLGMRTWHPPSEPPEPLPAEVTRLIDPGDAAATIAALRDARYDVEIVLVEGRPLPPDADPLRPPRRIYAFKVPTCPANAQLVFVEQTGAPSGIRVVVG